MSAKFVMCWKAIACSSDGEWLTHTVVDLLKKMFALWVTLEVLKNIETNIQGQQIFHGKGGLQY